MITTTSGNLRPGIYSSYTISSNYASPRSKKIGALHCVFKPKFKDSNYFTVKTVAQAESLLENDSSSRTALLGCKILLLSGVSEVLMISRSNSSMSDLEPLKTVKNIGAIISDCEEEDITAVLNVVKSLSDNQQECFGIFGVSTVYDAEIFAQTLNHQRGVVCFPAGEYGGVESPVLTACALAGSLLTAIKPTINLNGLAFPLLTHVENVSEEVVQHLLLTGVSVFEEIGGQVECIRGVTTKTTTNDVTDFSLRSITAVLTIDDIMNKLRSGLRAKLKGDGLSTLSLDSISSQVIVELDAMRDDGLLSDYKLPSLSPHKEDPSICVVELTFSIAHVIGQIHITAHIGL